MSTLKDGIPSRSRKIDELTADAEIISLFHETLDIEKRQYAEKLDKLEKALVKARTQADANAAASDMLDAKEFRQLRLTCIQTALVKGVPDARAAADEMLVYVLSGDPSEFEGRAK